MPYTAKGKFITTEQLRKQGEMVAPVDGQQPLFAPTTDYGALAGGDGSGGEILPAAPSRTAVEAGGNQVAANEEDYNTRLKAGEAVLPPGGGQQVTTTTTRNGKSIASSGPATRPGATNTNPYPKGSAEASLWDTQNEARAVRAQNDLTYEEWSNKYLPGVDEAIEAANSGDQEAVDRLQGIIDGIQDPKLADWVESYVSKAATAGPSQEAMDRQRADYDKMKSLSDPTITAEERLMQEMSRREQEQYLRAQGGAIKNDLQERGVYGSGQELTRSLMAQSEAANRRALDEMGMLSNAQNRAMEMLKGSADLGGKIRESEAQEDQFRGSAADLASKFNDERRDKFNEWTVDQKRKNNDDTIQRGVTGTNAQVALGDRGVSRASGAAQLALGGTTIKTGNKIESSKPVFDSMGRIADYKIMGDKEDEINS